MSTTRRFDTVAKYLRTSSRHSAGSVRSAPLSVVTHSRGFDSPWAMSIRCALFPSYLSEWLHRLRASARFLPSCPRRVARIVLRCPRMSSWRCSASCASSHPVSSPLRVTYASCVCPSCAPTLLPIPLATSLNSQRSLRAVVYSPLSREPRCPRWLGRDGGGGCTAVSGTGSPAVSSATASAMPSSVSKPSATSSSDRASSPPARSSCTATAHSRTPVCSSAPSAPLSPSRISIVSGVRSLLALLACVLTAAGLLSQVVCRARGV